MKQYLVNKNAQSTGEHEVHESGCGHLPAAHNRQYLGQFIGCKAAVIKAKDYYDNVDGCAYCCPDCHTR